MDKVVTDERALALYRWTIKQKHMQSATVQSATAQSATAQSATDWIMVSGDASFRRYFRLSVKDQTYIAVDAPPQHENCQAFIQIAGLLRRHRIHVPEVMAYDSGQGFMLLSDLGDQLLLSQLNNENVDYFYRQAIEVLIRMRSIPASELSIPPYDAQRLRQEMDLFGQWFLIRHLKMRLSSTEQQLLEQVYQLMIDNALEQPQGFVHRDYHSRNLMVLAGGALGVIDFQDAVTGPVTYDVASLLRDSYIRWPMDRVYAWLECYRTSLIKNDIISEVSPQQFKRWFDWMGLQRHIKVMGIFSRLHLRDGKSGYLADIPRTLQYALDVVVQYPELQALGDFLKNSVMPELRRKDG